MAGGNKGISDKPIRLKICSVNVLCASPTLQPAAPCLLTQLRVCSTGDLQAMP